jgi:acyl phosphate:glycerol-3-phosphate acyltransferase
MVGVLCTIVAYFLGSIPWGYLIVRACRGIDVRTTGSGATGATNVMRNLGIAGFVATLALDAGKGYASVILASRMTGNDQRWVAAAAVAAIGGHIFPLWLGFRGGKGVATGIGVFVALAPLPLAVCLLVFGIVVAAWRYISLGPVISAAAFPVVIYFLDHPPLDILLGATAASLLIITRHHANLRRLWNRTEPKVGKSQPAPERHPTGSV